MLEGTMDVILLGGAALIGGIFFGFGYFLHKRMEWSLAESI